jgi:hypothetical protein
MLKKFAVVLIAIPMFGGSAHAMTTRSSSLSHAHFPTCSDGLVKAICVCRAADTSRRHVLCRSGRYCHTFDGACRQ